MLYFGSLPAAELWALGVRGRRLGGGGGACMPCILPRVDRVPRMYFVGTCHSNGLLLSFPGVDFWAVSQACPGDPEYGFAWLPPLL